MDDTLFDHALTCRAALTTIRSEVSALRHWSRDDLWQEYQRLLDQHSYERTASPSVYARLRAERFQHLASVRGEELSAGEAMEVSHRYRDHYQRLRRAVPGGPGLVRRIAARTRVGMVTNNEVPEQEEKLRFLGLDGYVDPLVVSAAERVAKPDRRIFDIALARAGVRRKDAVMVGDSWTNDVMGARAAGIRPVWFNRFGRPRPGRHKVAELRSFRPAARAEGTIRGPARRSRPSSQL